MSRVENVSRFVAALAQNPNHANEPMKELVNMAEELADEVEKRPSCDSPEYVLWKGMVIKAEHESFFRENFDDPDILKQRINPLKIIQWITAVVCLIMAAIVLGYGFYNACRWVWNFYQ